MIVKFRPMQAEDKELFKSFIRLLPPKDNYYLLIDVQNDQAIDRWIEKIHMGHTIGVVATNGSNMIGYCNLKQTACHGQATSVKFASAFQPHSGDAEWQAPAGQIS